MAAPAERLSVYLNERFLGLLEARPPALAFAYDQAYLASADARPISLSLPLREEPFKPEAARAFFAGLLPEGPERERIARYYRLSTMDEFGLLKALGEDCAGAVVILPEDETPPERASWDYREIAEDELEGTLRLPPVAGPDARGRGRTRLSLAGAQAKVALYRDGAGRLMEPRNGAPSNVIIKPDLGGFPGVARLEAFCMALARAVGLPVPATELLVCGETEACLVERYDRPEGPDGLPRRLHQEDFCQAMGLPPEAKYEEQGRVSLAACFELIDRSVARPAQARWELLKWVVFNFLIGNADAFATAWQSHGAPGALL
jgi:serine/threonine-protein kinase HipA